MRSYLLRQIKFKIDITTYLYLFCIVYCTILKEIENGVDPLICQNKKKMLIRLSYQMKPFLAIIFSIGIQIQLY